MALHQVTCVMCGLNIKVISSEKIQAIDNQTFIIDKIHGLKDFKNKSISIYDRNSNCLTVPDPSEENPECIQFKGVMGENNMPKAGEGIILKTETISTRCYGNSNSKKLGWCGTCTIGAKKGNKKQQISYWSSRTGTTKRLRVTTRH